RPAVFDRYILTLNVAGLFQALAECGQMLRIRTGEGYVQKANHRQRWLLCARREWPGGCRATNEGDEFAALHCGVSRALNQQNSTPQLRQESAALQQFGPICVADGSIATDEVEVTRPRMSASPLKADNLHTISASVRFVPILL